MILYDRSPKYERYLDLSLTLAPHHFFGETGTPRVFTDGSVASVLSPDGVVPPGTPSVVTPSVSTRRHSRMTDLRDCLLEFTSRETLNQMLTCERCHEPRKTSKQLSLTSTPPVLVIQLKRFDAISQKKLSTPVKFPIRDLDMTPFMSKNVYDDKVGFVDPPSARFTPRTSSTTASHNHVRISTIDEEIPRGNSSGSGAHGDIFVASSSSSGSQNPETEVLSTDPSKNLSQTSSNSNNSSSGGSAVPRLSLIVPSIETNPPSTQSALHNDSVVYDLCGLVSHIGSLNQV